MNFITIILNLKRMFGATDIYGKMAVDEMAAIESAALEGGISEDDDHLMEWGDDNGKKWVRWSYGGNVGTKFYYR